MTPTLSLSRIVDECRPLLWRLRSLYTLLLSHNPLDSVPAELGVG